jgi:phosphatidylglycerophosphate synthase
MKLLPIYLIALRFLLAPVMIYLGYFYKTTSGRLIVFLLIVGLLSDIFDGIIARKQKMSTAILRRLDSQTDMIFWVSAGFTAWLIWPEVIKANHLVIYILFGMEALCYLISFLKFGKETCLHAYLSKLWGLTLLAAFIDLILNGHAGFLFYLCLITGIISHLDRILITLLLPTWQHDVPSTYHAWLVRKGKSFRRFRIFNG